MFDINEIQNRALAARKQAAEVLQEQSKKMEELTESLADRPPEEPEESAAAREAAQAAANQQRQVEILGQMLDPEAMARMAANQADMERMMAEQVAQATAMGAGAVMEQIFGEDMGVIAAALETLAMEEDDGDEAEEEDFSSELEERLCGLLEETMARIEALPEPEPVPYGKDGAQWERFGILLSGIVSTINDHRLDGMDVEEHIPVMEQQVASIVRRSWGVNGRSDLLDMIRYLTREGYIFRYRLYSEAASPEDLVNEDADEEERESAARAWRFVQRYKGQYAPGFLAGWDIGRAAMLTRWGSYLGWITGSEATGILWDLSQIAAEELHSWREFAQSYLFGGLMWKLLCGDPSAASYLGYVADAAVNLIVGREDGTGGQWKAQHWPARRKIGFSI